MSYYSALFRILSPKLVPWHFGGFFVSYYPPCLGPQVGAVSDLISSTYTHVCAPVSHLCDLVGADCCRGKLVPCRILEATLAAAAPHSSLSPRLGPRPPAFRWSNTQTNKLQAGLSLRLLVITLHIHSDDQHPVPLSLVVEGEVARAPTLCHQAVACWCNRAPPQARATFTRVLPPPAPTPIPLFCPSSGQPLSALPKLFVFLPLKSLSFD